jgi:hypothetical protein
MGSQIATQKGLSTDQKLNDANFPLAFVPCCGCIARFTDVCYRSWRVPHGAYLFDEGIEGIFL